MKKNGRPEALIFCEFGRMAGKLINNSFNKTVSFAPQNNEIMKLNIKILSLCLLMCAGFNHVIVAQYSGGTVSGYNAKNTALKTSHSELSGRKYKFEVTLKNGEVINVESSIQTFDKKLFIGYKKNGSPQMVNPSDTKKIVALLGSNRIPGVVTDSCWLFLLGSEKIKFYAIEPELRKKNFVAVQKGNDGTIVPLSKKNLKELFNTNNEEILIWIEEGKFFNAIKRYNELEGR